jgi:hypothetical protein
MPSLDRILVSHGDPIEREPSRVLRDLAASLDRRPGTPGVVS